jgi:hypothetical protein
MTQEKSDYSSGTGLDSASDLTSPLQRTPTTAAQTAGVATEPTRAHPAEPPMLSKTDPKLDVPASVAPRQTVPEYKAPNVERADQTVPVYEPGASKFSNIVEVDE